MLNGPESRKQPLSSGVVERGVPGVVAGTDVLRFTEDVDSAARAIDELIPPHLAPWASCPERNQVAYDG